MRSKRDQEKVEVWTNRVGRTKWQAHEGENARGGRTRRTHEDAHGVWMAQQPVYPSVLSISRLCASHLAVPYAYHAVTRG